MLLAQYVPQLPGALPAEQLSISHLQYDE